jgi:hypothetical protein
MANATILGTGGWLPPEGREALDWMTLVRLLGWRVKLISPDEFSPQMVSDHHIKWIIIADNPEKIESNIWDKLLQAVRSNKLLLLWQAANPESQLACRMGISIHPTWASGDLLEWQGGSKIARWHCRTQVQLPVLHLPNDFHKVVTLSGHTLVGAKKMGAGKLLAISFNASQARDQEGGFSALLKHLLIYESLLPVAWYEWKNTLILRMDDPGSAEVLYNEAYNVVKLGTQEWTCIGQQLMKRHGKMSVAYVSGWVDDGDVSRGVLQVDGHPATRLPGAMHPTPLVRYEKLPGDSSNKVYDFAAEYESIRKLLSAELLDLQLHGHTHLHSDIEAWLTSPDRYSNTAWYREFGPEATRFIEKHPEQQHPLDHGMDTISLYFGKIPSTLIFPGEEYTQEALEKALQAGFTMVSSYYLALRIGKQLCWNQHVCAPYLNKPDQTWFDSELPVVGYFHDFDISTHGTTWFEECLDQWQAAGAKTLLGFDDLAACMGYYVSLEEHTGTLLLTLVQENNNSLNKAIQVNIYRPDGKLPDEVTVSRNGKKELTALSQDKDTTGTVRVSAYDKQRYMT